MGRRKENFRNDNFYHIYNSGVEKLVIFKDKQDFFQFLKMMELFNNTVSKGSSVNYRRKSIPKNKEGEKVQWEKEEKLVEVLAYSLVKNHFHLVLKQHSQKGIAKFMQKVSTGYAMYFNKKYSRRGSLFKSRFLSDYVEQDDLDNVGVYVNLNHKIHDMKVESFKLVSSENANKITYVSSWSEYMKKSKWKICQQSYLLEDLKTARKYRNFAEALVKKIKEDEIIFLEK